LIQHHRKRHPDEESDKDNERGKNDGAKDTVEIIGRGEQLLKIVPAHEKQFVSEQGKPIEAVIYGLDGRDDQKQYDDKNGRSQQ